MGNLVGCGLATRGIRALLAGVTLDGVAHGRFTDE
jgi:hypothetical protein